VDDAPGRSRVDDHLLQLKEILGSGDIVIDGGNTYYKDDIRRAAVLEDKEIRFMDAGVSGGIWGLKVGYCLMVGGPKETFEHLKPLFETLAPEGRIPVLRPYRGGHFVKMVHNGIEYGMMQAYGEGFQILDASSYAGSLNYAEVAICGTRERGEVMVAGTGGGGLCQGRQAHGYPRGMLKIQGKVAGRSIKPSRQGFPPRSSPFP
jgi:6-phosphogluconate dehydrogenase (decarboxylating)